MVVRYISVNIINVSEGFLEGSFSRMFVGPWLWKQAKIKEEKAK
jgi:hypothetical protein